MPKDDPPCPRKKCQIDRAVEERLANDERFKKMVAEQRPPGHIGDKPVVRAIYETAQIVMQDHKLTDLKDSMREGDIAAPRLPPQQQAAADAFFSGGAVANEFKRRGMGRVAAQARMLGAQVLANGGAAFRGQGPRIAKIQASQGHAGDSALVADHVGQGMTKLRVRSG
jgi:hypothetical protein